jgi:AcrR family transcriptional regulator
MSVFYEEKKDLIKQCAVRTFRQYGYNKSTLDDIAKQLGMKKTTLYYYFKNKEDIFNEIIKDEVRLLIEDLNTIIKSRKDVSGKLLGVVHKLIYYGKERSTVYSISLETFLEIGEIINKSFLEIKYSIRDLIAGILISGVKTGELKKHNSAELAGHIIETLRAYEYKEYHSNLKVASIKDIELEHIEKRMSYILKLILEGLKTS